MCSHWQFLLPEAGGAAVENRSRLAHGEFNGCSTALALFARLQCLAE